MVEQARVNRDDIGVSTLVIRMASHTLITLRPWKASVKAGLSSAIDTYIFVAAHAQRRNRLVGARIVACDTLAFELGMTFDHTARHQQLFQTRRENVTSAKHKQCDAESPDNLCRVEIVIGAAHIE